jgi:Ras-related GTP-binding protein A/B
MEEEKDNLNLIKEKPFIKILLMGKTGVGKTSIKSIIFENKLPKDTLELACTNEIEESHLKFMKIFSLNLLDFCSKEEYIKEYFDSKKEAIFSNVKIFIFVAEPENYNQRNEKDNLDDIVYFEK